MRLRFRLPWACQQMYYLRVIAEGKPKQPVVAAECEKKCRARRVTLMKNKYRFGPESRGIFQQTWIYIKSAVRRKVFRIHARSIYKDTYFLRGRKKPRLSVLQIKTCYSCGQIRAARTQPPGAHGARATQKAARWRFLFLLPRRRPPRQRARTERLAAHRFLLCSLPSEFN